MAKRKTPVIKCRATSKTTKKRCGNDAIAGGLVCHIHGGAASQVANKAAVVAEVYDWNIDATTVDPSQTLLRILTVTFRRAEQLSGELDKLIEDGAVEALTSKLAFRDADERDRVANLAMKAINANLAGRIVDQKLAIGDLVFNWFEATLQSMVEKLGLPAEQVQEAKLIGFEKMELLRGSQK